VRGEGGFDSRVEDMLRLSRIARDPSEDPVRQQLEGVRTLIERYHKSGLHNI
jgi:hypothetical protein